MRRVLAGATRELLSIILADAPHFAFNELVAQETESISFFTNGLQTVPNICRKFDNIFGQLQIIFN